jgi:hypothetical protein
MLSDLFDVSDALAPVAASYHALESLISSSSLESLDGQGLGFILASVNKQLQTVIDGIDEARRVS